MILYVAIRTKIRFHFAKKRARKVVLALPTPPTPPIPPVLPPLTLLGKVPGKRAIDPFDPFVAATAMQATRPPTQGRTIEENARSDETTKRS